MSWDDEPYCDDCHYLVTKCRCVGERWNAYRRCEAGAYWLGILGFALAAPAATERALDIMTTYVSACGPDPFGESLKELRYGAEWER